MEKSNNNNDSVNINQNAATRSENTADRAGSASPLRV
jgi:hypothetical protein